jgi:hypothetical protein
VTGIEGDSNTKSKKTRNREQETRNLEFGMKAKRRVGAILEW